MRPPRQRHLLAVAAAVWLVAIAVPQVLFRWTGEVAFGEAHAAATLTHLRAAVRGPVEPLPPGLEGLEDAVVPLVLTAWVDGERALVTQSDAPLHEAVPALAAALTADPLPRGRTRLQLDAAVATGWLPRGGPAFALAFVEGHTGVAADVGWERVYVAPPELLRKGRYGAENILPDGVPYARGWKIGLGEEAAREALRSQAVVLGLEVSSITGLARFRALTVVEGADLAPRRLAKATVDKPPLTRARAEAAVRVGADYLRRSTTRAGKFRYAWDPIAHARPRGRYSWTRHAGTAWALAQVGRILADPALVRTAHSPLERLVEQLVPGPGGGLCLDTGDGCYLGAAALSLLALSEYRIASGEPHLESEAAALARHLAFMQRDDGTFRHRWFPEERRMDEEEMALYASQQAVLALARHAAATGDQAALDAAVRGMDHLAGPFWDHFLGQFFFGEEHWTCLAAEEVYAAVPRPEYADLCYDLGSFFARLAHDADATPFAEDAGGVSFTHAFTPHVGGTATVGEALVSAVVLGRATGRDTAALERQVVATTAFLVRAQVTADDTFWIRRPERALGGIYMTQTNPQVRIDTVQHAISATARALEFLPE